MYGSNLPGVFWPRPPGTHQRLHPDSLSEAREPRLRHERCSDVSRCLQLRVIGTDASGTALHPPGPPALNPPRLGVRRPRPAAAHLGARSADPARKRSPEPPAPPPVLTCPARRHRLPIPLCRQQLPRPHPHAGRSASYYLPGPNQTPAHCPSEPARVPGVLLRGPAHPPPESQFPVSASRGPAHPPLGSQSGSCCAPCGAPRSAAATPKPCKR